MNHTIEPAYSLPGFAEVPPYKKDEIFAAKSLWTEDRKTHPESINAAIGMIMSEETGKALMLDIVKQVRREVVLEDMGDYLSPAGHLGFLDSYAKFIFGDVLWNRFPRNGEMSGKPSTVVWMHTMGGTGAGYVGRKIADTFLVGDHKKLLWDSGWGNHKKMFRGYEFVEYPYENPETREYNHSEFMNLLENHPEGNPVLMQVVGHNGTGADRTDPQWNEIIDIVAKRRLLPMLDMPYNLLAKGEDNDHFAPVAFVERGIPLMLYTSRSKNMTWPNGRLGAMYFINVDPITATRLQGTAEDEKVRPVWSNPPYEPAAVAHQIHSNPEKQTQYLNEIEPVRLSLDYRRAVICETLGEDFAWIKDRNGLFLTFMLQGFTDSQMHFLREENHIHGLPNSRVNIGGLPESRIHDIADLYRQAIFEH